ncbi:MFS transporter [Streptomyces mayteni]
MRRCLLVAFLARLADEGLPLAVLLLAQARTESPALGAFTLAAWLAPHVLAAPVTGTLLARARRPRPLYAAALGCFAAAVAGVALTLGRVPAPVTLAVALAGGCCGPIVTGGMSSLLAGLAPPGAARDRAYALDAGSYNAASVAGPGAVGLAATALSPGLAAGLLVAPAALAAALAPTLPIGAEAAPKAKEPAPWAAGAVALWRVPELRAITAATTVAFLGIGGVTTTAVLLAAEHGRPAGGGALMTAFALGALASSLLLARRAPRLAPPALAGLALLGLGLALGGAALAPSYPTALPCFALAGLCDGPLLTATLRIRADHAPPAARAQVFTVAAGLKITAASCGTLLAGLAADVSPAALLLAIAACQLAGAAVLRGVRGAGDTPCSRSASPPRPRRPAGRRR